MSDVYNYDTTQSVAVVLGAALPLAGYSTVGTIVAESEEDR